MAVTPAQIAQIQADFDKLLNDILPLLPPSPQLSMAIMLFKVAEVAVNTLLQEHVIPGT